MFLPCLPATTESAGNCLNAANEKTVEAFLKGGLTGVIYTLCFFLGGDFSTKPARSCGLEEERVDAMVWVIA